MKVSFDFDSTLDRLKIQEYAVELMKRGFDVWICTSRYEPSRACRKDWNDDLFEVADNIGIKRENIIFTNMANKSEFLKNKDFIFHIDDDNIELSFIKTDTDVTPVFLFGNKFWRSDCENAIEIYQKRKDMALKTNWVDFAEKLKMELGESLIDEGDENNPLDYWLQDVTVSDIVEFCKKYHESNN